MDLELECLLDFNGAAAWRRQVAEKYPEDVRNLIAAEMLERLGTETEALEGSQLHKALAERWLQADQKDALEASFSQKVSEHLRSVGFGYRPTNATAFVDDLLQII